MASLEEIRNARLEKLRLLRGRGIDPYPIISRRTYTLAEVKKKFESLEKSDKTITVSGRVTALRGQGAVFFIDLNDGEGTLQALAKKDSTNEFDFFEKVIDIGDFIEVLGTLFTTKRGEKTINVLKWEMLAKSLRPLPEKWHGLQDTEERFRRRYLDLLSSPEVKERFMARSRIVSSIRGFLDKKGFVEVETPVLQHLPGGASALPFRTYHNFLDIDLHLRIAPELYLKELLIGGMPKVYEVSRNFRNEGIDVTHNPEFTTVEWYESFSDAKEQRLLIEKLLRVVVKKVTGQNKITYQNNKIDFSKKFTVVSYYDLLEKYSGIKNPAQITLEELRTHAQKFSITSEKGDSVEKLLDAIYKKTCRGNLIMPTFVVNYPTKALPLAKRFSKNPDLVDAFQLVVGGLEIVKAFSELNDPIDQEERFLEQEKNKAAGDKEAQSNDKDFVEAMEYGMPPAGGVGLSIDRLTMLLTNAHNIREVILFPTLRPKQ
mgnify:CR=1 FL=1